MARIRLYRGVRQCFFFIIMWSFGIICLFWQQTLYAKFKTSCWRPSEIFDTFSWGKMRIRRSALIWNFFSDCFLCPDNSNVSLIKMSWKQRLVLGFSLKFELKRPHLIEFNCFCATFHSPFEKCIVRAWVIRANLSQARRERFREERRREPTTSTKIVE